MSDRRYDAMRQAVQLALSGRCTNWWSVSARLLAKRFREADVSWNQSQRQWLDQLCTEARRGPGSSDSAWLAPSVPGRSLFAVIDGGAARQPAGHAPALGLIAAAAKPST